MLVLGRKVGQQIVMGKGMITLKVLKVRDGTISIGIQAPEHFDVDREEIYLKKQRQAIRLVGVN